VQGSDERENRAVRQFQPLFDGLKAGLPPTTMLVFTGGAAGERHPFVTRIKELDGSVVEEYPELQGEKLYRWIREEAAMLGIRFKNGSSRRPIDPDDEWQRPNETDPVILLANLHPVPSARPGIGRASGGDTMAIANELEKLALATMGGEATVDDVDVHCGGQRQLAVWTLTDTIHDGNAPKAMAALRAIRSQGFDSQSIIGLIASSYRIFGPTLDALEDSLSEEEIGRAIGRNWQVGRQMAIRRARNLGEAGLRQALAEIVSADRSIKAGEVDEDVAVEILVMQLAALARPQRRR
jgi:DNA polymerase III delta subunit